MKPPRKSAVTYVTARASVQVNQHAPRYAHKATKRNRSRAAQRSHAIADAR